MILQLTTFVMTRFQLPSLVLAGLVLLAGNSGSTLRAQETEQDLPKELQQLEQQRIDAIAKAVPSAVGIFSPGLSLIHI